MIFADIHNHSLASADDGASTEEAMYNMVEAAYADGVRLLCLTPHFHPVSYGDNREASQNSFEKLCAYSAGHCPGLRLYLGNELRYSPNCDNWMREGLCRTLGSTSLVLVDFSADVGESLIIRGLSQLMSMGYQPILAHAERYASLSRATVQDLHRNGIQIQINAGSLTGDCGWIIRLRAKRLLCSRLVCMVASDAHNLRNRPPLLSSAYQIAVKLTDKDYADRIFYGNVCDLLEKNQEGLVKEDE